MLTTWLRIKNGYPLDGAWGQAVYPQKNEEVIERVKLLSSENAQLRAELGSIKDRLATVERIVTDDSHRLTQEIESAAHSAQLSAKNRGISTMASWIWVLIPLAAILAGVVKQLAVDQGDGRSRR